MSRDEVIDFSYKIEELAHLKNISHMDAVLLYCESVGFEVEVAAKLLSASLRAKIRLEAEELHFLPKSGTTKLPLT